MLSTEDSSQNHLSGAPHGKGNSKLSSWRHQNNIISYSRVIWEVREINFKKYCDYVVAWWFEETKKNVLRYVVCILTVLKRLSVKHVHKMSTSTWLFQCEDNSVQNSTAWTQWFIIQYVSSFGEGERVPYIPSHIVFTWNILLLNYFCLFS